VDEQIKNSIDRIEKLVNDRMVDDVAFGDNIVAKIYKKAEEVAKDVVTVNDTRKFNWDKKLDDILTSRITGYPIMLILLGLVFWITIEGANVPSSLLADLFFSIEGKITELFMSINAPAWLHGILVLGIYRTVAWVVSVMLPPMAIFFPIFTLLEDLGYLPRVAFNLDNAFRKAGTHGKQALTMSMGFGCNAAGIVACRIIDSPRERLIAMITNNFVPCNGRFPTLIAISSVFFGGYVISQFDSVFASLSVVALVLIGIMVTLLISKFLSVTLLKGVPSSFTLELPPYRKPQIGRIIVRSIFDRTLFVLGRAVIVAAPAGAVTWIFANIMIGDVSLLNHVAGFLDPFGSLLGLDGFILMAFILGLPANEIVLPILFMSYMSQGAMLELDSIDAIRSLLVENGWTWITGINFMLFSLLHFPCATTLLTMRKETNSIRWPMFSFLLTTSLAIGVTFIINTIGKILGLV